MNEPMLGLATTEQLFRELITRFTTDYPHSLASTQQAVTLAEMLGSLDARQREYRTVDAL